MRNSLENYLSKALEEMSAGTFAGTESEKKQILDIAKAVVLKEMDDESDDAKREHEAVMLDKRNAQEKSMEEAKMVSSVTLENVQNEHEVAILNIKNDHETELEKEREKSTEVIRKMELTAQEQIERLRGQASIDVAKTAGWFNLGGTAITGVSTCIGSGLGALGGLGRDIAMNGTRWKMARMVLDEVVSPERSGDLSIGTSTGRSMVQRLGQDVSTISKI